MPLGHPVAQGRTAEVYLWKEGWIIKLFHEWFPGEAVRYEAQIARTVHEARLPVPAVGKVAARMSEGIGELEEWLWGEATTGERAG